jgi:periplasmic protein TonB
LNVELTSDPLPPINAAPPPPNLLQPPPMTKPAIVPPAPPMMAVAAPSPRIAFAVPVAAPARIVPAEQASFRTVEKPPVEVAPTAPTPQPLTFGQGEGKQPAPEYPRQSLREGQEGVVTMHVTVGEDGRVLAAQAVKPSPWPLLNNAALRVARSRWRFEPRGLRTVEISVRFELTK